MLDSLLLAIKKQKQKTFFFFNLYSLGHVEVKGQLELSLLSASPCVPGIGLKSLSLVANTFN